MCFDLLGSFERAFQRQVNLRLAAQLGCLRGKKIGGDILANKKTFLLIKAMEVATSSQSKQIKELMQSNGDEKVKNMLAIFESCGVDEWAKELKEKFIANAFQQLEDTAVLSSRKKPLQELAEFLVQREY